jgi:cold shock CspA family protein
MDDGIVIWFDHQKGYGFIKRSDGKEMFMHTKLMLPDGSIRPGDRVQFESSNNLDGLAKDVRLVKHRHKKVNKYINAKAANF